MRRIFLILLMIAAVHGAAQQAPSVTSNTPTANPKHFDRVLVVILENQAYVTAIKDKYLKQLADEGVEFTDFHALAHPSYPKLFRRLIAGSTFGMHGIFGDDQNDFPDDNQHRTIGDELDWKNYAEEYPGKPGKPAYLYDATKYALKTCAVFKLSKSAKTRTSKCHLSGYEKSAQRFCS